MSPSSPAARARPADYATNGEPNYTTKLAVRNRTNNGTISSRSSASRARESTVPSKEQPSLRESRSNLSQASQPTDRQASKKKLGGVLGFLKLKEPSTSALQDYADHERKRAAQRGSKATAAGISGASLQKLPEHVPKVNSRWDGLPETPKAKQRRHTERGCPDNAAGARVSVSSRASTISRPENEGRLDTRSLGAQTYSHSIPSPSTKHPALQDYAKKPAENRLPNIPSQSASSPPSSSVITRQSPASELPELLAPDSSSCLSMSPETSPRTPAFEEGAFALPNRNRKSLAVTESQQPAIRSHCNGA